MMEYTFRDAIREKSPWWLRGWLGERLLYAIAIQLDALMDALVAGVRLRFPGRYGYESLPLIATETRDVRGLDETDADFAGYLRTWRSRRRRRGNVLTLLERLRHYLIIRHSGVWFEVVYNNGTDFTFNNAAVFSRGSRAWDWDGQTSAWSRFWVIIHGANWVDEGTWGDPGTVGDGGTIGSDMTPEESEGIRSIIAFETPPHAKCVAVLVILDEAEWAANQPDGTWDLRQNRHDVGILYLDGR